MRIYKKFFYHGLGQEKCFQVYKVKVLSQGGQKFGVLKANPLQIKKGYHIIGGCVENGILQKVISEWDQVWDGKVTITKANVNQFKWIAKK